MPTLSSRQEQTSTPDSTFRASTFGITFGATIGGVAGVALLVWIVFFVYRRIQRKRSPDFHRELLFESHLAMLWPGKKFTSEMRMKSQASATNQPMRLEHQRLDSGSSFAPLLDASERDSVPVHATGHHRTDSDTSAGASSRPAIPPLEIPGSPPHTQMQIPHSTAFRYTMVDDMEHNDDHDPGSACMSSASALSAFPPSYSMSVDDTRTMQRVQVVGAAARPQLMYAEAGTSDSHRSLRPVAVQRLTGGPRATALLDLPFPFIFKTSARGTLSVPRSPNIPESPAPPVPALLGAGVGQRNEHGHDPDSPPISPLSPPPPANLTTVHSAVPRTPESPLSDAIPTLIAAAQWQWPEVPAMVRGPSAWVKPTPPPLPSGPVAPLEVPNRDRPGNAAA